MQYNEWLTSAHANVAERPSNQRSYAADTCLTCHSQDARQTAALIAQVESGRPRRSAAGGADSRRRRSGASPARPATSSTPTPTSRSNWCRQPTTCARAVTANPEGRQHPSPGDGDVRGRWRWWRGSTACRASTSSEENGPRCVTCHMQAASRRATRRPAPVTASRRFCPATSDTLPSACAGCHTDLTTTDLALLVKNTQDAVRARLDGGSGAAGKPCPDARRPTTRYQQVVAALDFVQSDGSFGIHNYAYTDALLSAAEQDLALLTRLSHADRQRFAPTVTPPSEVVDRQIERALTARLPAASARSPCIVIGFVVAILLIAAFAFFRKRDV